MENVTSQLVEQNCDPLSGQEFVELSIAELDEIAGGQSTTAVID